MWKIAYANVRCERCGINLSRALRGASQTHWLQTWQCHTLPVRTRGAGHHGRHARGGGHVASGPGKSPKWMSEGRRKKYECKVPTKSPDKIDEKLSKALNRAATWQQKGPGHMMTYEADPSHTDIIIIKVLGSKAPSAYRPISLRWVKGRGRKC